MGSDTRGHGSVRDLGSNLKEKSYTHKFEKCFKTCAFSWKNSKRRKILVSWSVGNPWPVSQVLVSTGFPWIQVGLWTTQVPTATDLDHLRVNSWQALLHNGSGSCRFWNLSIIRINEMCRRMRSPPRATRGTTRAARASDLAQRLLMWHRHQPASWQLRKLPMNRVRIIIHEWSVGIIELEHMLYTWTVIFIRNTLHTLDVY
jgi:hypothetical protein